MPFQDTILARSSPDGATGIRAILRLSGPHAWPLATAIASFFNPSVGHHHVTLTLGTLRPPAALLLFRAPRSFTGEDLTELQIPNSPALVALILQELLRIAKTQDLPTRLAQPGEFTARAFFNGKLDLTQAEGIAATINAANQAQLQAAASLRNGDLFRWTHATADRLANLLALVEAGIDFADEEDIRFVEAPHLRNTLAQLQSEIQSQLASSRHLARHDRPPTVVFIGQPNVGKSSLINALARKDRSIVSPIAGTTRDVLVSVMHTPRGDIQLFDVPGEEAPTDELRQKMMATRENALLEADLVVEVVAGEVPAIWDINNFDTPRLVVQNKADLLPTAIVHDFTPPAIVVPLEEPWQLVSAKTGLHVAELRDHLAAKALDRPPTAAGHLELNQRHRTILDEVLTTLDHATTLVNQNAAAAHPELLAAELRRALDFLGQLTGTISPDEVLGRIFSQFCLGK